MSDPIVMGTPDPSDHAARAKVFLDNIHDRMRGGDGPELRTSDQKSLMATEALAHALLALNETLLSIFGPEAAVTHGTSDPGFETTPIAPGPIPGVEHYVTPDPATIIAGPILDGISEIEDFALARKPRRVLSSFNWDDAEQDVVPTGLDTSSWSHIFGATATARATGSRGAFTTDPATGIEYAITFRKVVSNDGFRVESSSSMVDVTLRGDEHLITFNVLGVDPDRPLGDRLLLSAWQRIIAAGKTCLSSGANHTVATDPETGDMYELFFRDDMGQTSVVDVFDGVRP